MGVIGNAANRPLFDRTGTVPDVGGALLDYFQPMIFTPIKKSVSGFQAVEASNPIKFRGVIQPFTERQLLLLPEGQRSWTWSWLHSDPSLRLNTDDVVLYLGKQTRIMGLKDYSIYGYMEYKIIQDWTGSGP